MRNGYGAMLMQMPLDLMCQLMTEFPRCPRENPRPSGDPQTGLPGRKSPNSASPRRRRPPKPCRRSACPLGLDGLGLPPARVRLTDSHLPSDCPALGDFRRLYSFSRYLSRKNRSTSVEPPPFCRAGAPAPAGVDAVSVDSVVAQSVGAHRQIRHSSVELSAARLQ